VKPEVKTVPVSKQTSKKCVLKRRKNNYRTPLFVKLFLNVPNFAFAGTENYAGTWKQ
jgi:hypothetical protein